MSAPPAPMPGWLTLLLAVACGLLAANLYYAQPLTGPISASLGLSPAAAGLIVTLTQAGYGLGLLLLVPLADLLENRRLVVAAVAASGVALAVAALSASALPFLLAAFAIGVCSVAAQILVPYAAGMAPEALRGRVVGNVMSGLLLGIMLARPAASLVAGLAGWHAVFWLSAALMALLAVALRRLLPRRQPAAALRYGALLASLGGIWRGQPVLRHRALAHAGMFAAFMLFWTAMPLHLARDFGMSQFGIAVFALAAVTGAVVAPLAGRIGDAGQRRPGLSHRARLAALAVGALSFPVGLLGQGPFAIVALVVAGILLDAAVTVNMILSQRAVFALGEAIRGRVNGLFIATFFMAGAMGAALGGWAMATGGWTLAAWAGAALPAAGLLYAATRGAGGDARRTPLA